MNRWQFYIVLLIGFCLGPAALTSQAQSSSPDAMTVRAIYAKVEMASQLQDLRDQLGNPNPTKKSIHDAGSLHFVLSEIKTGSINDIRSLMLADLVTKPSGRTLFVTPSRWNFTASDGETLHAMSAQISWTQSPYFTEDWNIPISRVIDMGVIDPAYSRYASFTVRAIYQGEQRDYQALFLFSDDPEKQSTVFTVDHIIGMSALQTLSADQSLPEPLLAQPFRTRPEVSSFIEWWRGQPGCSTDAHTGMCCNPATGQCGVSSRALQVKGLGAIQSSNVLPAGSACGAPCPASSTTTITPNPFSDINDTTGHLQNELNPNDPSYHSGHVTFNAVCNYSRSTAPCTGTCNVLVANPGTVELGATNGCHVMVPFSDSTTTPAGGTPPLPCSTTWGYKVRLCKFCTCTLAELANPVFIHTWQHTVQWTCP